MAPDAAAGAVIDADVHCSPPETGALLGYLDDHWREFLQSIRSPIRQGSIGRAIEDTAYPTSIPLAARPEARSADGTLASASLAGLRAHVFDGTPTERAVLNCSYAVDSLRNPDLAAALAAAVNDWLVAEWLEPEPRLRASLLVPSRFPDLAVAEIERAAAHDGFVQVLLPARSEVPYGNRRYHPVLAAAARHGLAVSIQYGGFSGNPPTPVGWPTYLAEEHVAMAQVMQAQLVSLVAEGAFDAIDDLRVVLVEGGFTWLPSLLWRTDKDWKGLRREVPWVRRPPSAYVREHVRLTTQPLDLPGDAAVLARVLDQLGSDDLLLYATDFPHWHAGDPEAVLARELPEATRRKIAYDNARAFYGW